MNEDDVKVIILRTLRDVRIDVDIQSGEVTLDFSKVTKKTIMDIFNDEEIRIEAI